MQRQDSELAELRAKISQADRQVQIDRAATVDLAKQVKSLAFENAALKEDLAFFQSLMSAPGGREGTISVNRFRLQPEAGAGEYRYQMLLVQPGQRVGNSREPCSSSWTCSRTGTSSCWSCRRRPSAKRGITSSISSFFSASRALSS